MRALTVSAFDDTGVRTSADPASALEHHRTTHHRGITIRPTTAFRRGALLGALVLLAAGTTHAQPTRSASVASASSSPFPVAPVPFAVGEELTYKAHFGGIPAGSARMRVDGIEVVRGRPAYHVVFTLDGGIPFFRVHDRYESWIDVETLASLRHLQRISEGRYKRTTTYEIYPERAEYQKNDEAPKASVSNPLDDGSFIYAVRVAGVRVGETRRDNRYFRPDRNPVVLTGVRAETVTVGAGTFATTVVRPSIKTNGLFSDHGEAEVWFSDDATRYPVQVKTRFAKLSVTLRLRSVKSGGGAALGPLVDALREAP
jgi:hypothetical protein